MHIAFSCDANPKYAMLLRICLTSILHNAANGDTHHFHILDGGITQGDKAAIDTLQKIKSFSISYYPTGWENDYSAFNTRGLSMATYYRLRMGDFLHGLSKTLYLDTDMVVLCSLRDLFNADLGAYVFGACLDGAHETHAERLGVPAGSYFNAGLLLMDLDKWRKGNIYAKCLATAQKHADKITFHDQDILNLIFRGHYRLLPQTWNTSAFMVNAYALVRAKTEGAVDIPQHNILHFSGPEKLEAPAGAVLRKYAQMTGFSLEELMEAFDPNFMDKLRNRKNGFG
jgi:lipopolysaccharide biosynthesis glycosyltransferase